MNAQQLEIREQQKASWNKFSSGWKKWDDLTMEFLGPMGHAIVDYLQPSGAQQVLDIAGGTGEPGISIARRLNGGSVIITDLAPEMLEVALEKINAQHLKNVEVKACDVCELPFEDNRFDAVSCRFGFMFFPDMQLAANEILRVMKPGARFATTVWNIPEKNFWVTSIMGTIARIMELPPPPPEVPGMFRCAKPGRMEEIFRAAGLQDYREQEVVSKLNAGTVDMFWNMMTEVGAPIVAALSKADEPTKQRIKKEVFETVRERYPGDVNIDASAILITGKK